MNIYDTSLHIASLPSIFTLLPFVMDFTNGNKRFDFNKCKLAFHSTPSRKSAQHAHKSPVAKVAPKVMAKDYCHPILLPYSCACDFGGIIACLLFYHFRVSDT